MSSRNDVCDVVMLDGSVFQEGPSRAERGSWEYIKDDLRVVILPCDKSLESHLVDW